MPIFMQYDGIAGDVSHMVDPSDPNAVARKLAKVAPHSIRKASIRYSGEYVLTSVSHTATKHVPTPYEVDLVAILIGLLLPYMAAGAKLSLPGFQLSQAQVARFRDGASNTIMVG